MILYNLRTVAKDHYQIAKFDDDFNVAAVYDLIAKGSGFACTCPAGQRTVKLKPCRHQRMLPFMMGACNTDRFYEPETRSWVQPLSPDLLANADLTAEEIEALPDGVEKDYQHAMQDAVGEAVPDVEPTVEPRVVGDIVHLSETEASKALAGKTEAEVADLVYGFNKPTPVALATEPPKLRRRV